MTHEHLVYISGPMTGLPDLNFPAFFEAAAQLDAAGYAVINPATLNHPGADWHTCMRTDIKALCDCHTIALLPGWIASKGARKEFDLADWLGLRITTVDTLLHEATDVLRNTKLNGGP